MSRITVDALEQMSPQALFNFICSELLAQGKRSTTFDGYRCQYRGEGGTKCAVGMLIPDTLYKRNFEFMGVKELCERMGDTPNGMRIARVLCAHIDLLTRMQEIHDTVLPSEWREAMRVAAEKFGLHFIDTHGEPRELEHAVQ